jgi:hypothetical protein
MVAPRPRPTSELLPENMLTGGTVQKLTFPDSGAVLISCTDAVDLKAAQRTQNMAAEQLFLRHCHALLDAQVAHGGIVARIISRTGLDLVSGRMFAPSPELVKRYAETIVTESRPEPSRYPGVDPGLCSKKFHWNCERAESSRPLPSFPWS